MKADGAALSAVCLVTNFFTFYTYLWKVCIIGGLYFMKERLLHATLHFDFRAGKLAFWKLYIEICIIDVCFGTDGFRRGLCRPF